MTIRKIEDCTAFVCHNKEKQKGVLIGTPKELKYLYVLPLYRHQGVATELFNHYKTIAKPDFYVLVEKDNASAIKFYTSKKLKILGEARNKGRNWKYYIMGVLKNERI